MPEDISRCKQELHRIHNEVRQLYLITYEALYYDYLNLSGHAI